MEEQEAIKLYAARRMQRAMTGIATVSDAVMQRTPFLFETDMTELDLVHGIEKIFCDFEMDEWAFDPKVAFGKNTADFTHVPDETALQPGDIITIELAALHDDCACAETRTFFWLEMDPEIGEIYEELRRVCESAYPAVDVDAKAGDVAVKLLDVAGTSPYADAFQLAPDADFSKATNVPYSPVEDEDVLLEFGMVVNVDAGFSFPGKFGLRLGNAIMATDFGAELCTRYSWRKTILGEHKLRPN